ncbi:MAG: hypothetical protein ACI857_000527 [Arenicella sp.]|jgi:hypothetical protein
MMKEITVYIGSEHSETAVWLNDFKDSIKEESVIVAENDQKKKRRSDYILYVFTAKSEGILTIINVVNDANKSKEKTLLLTLMGDEEGGFTPHQKKSLIATGKMVERNGGKWFEKIEDVKNHILSSSRLVNKNH